MRFCILACIYNVCLGQQNPPGASGGFVVFTRTKWLVYVSGYKNIVKEILEIIDNPALKYLIFFIFLWYEIRSKPNYSTP
jgi:hypothetical protein